jgi:type IV secretory pathway VirJ component
LNAKKFVLVGYSFGADILPAIYNHLSTQDQKDVALIILLAMGKTADFEIHVSGWIEKNNSGIPILPELNRIPPQKILCVFGQEEKDECACNGISTTRDCLMELPGGHHFDYDYPKLAAKLIETFQRIELKKSN